MVPPGQEFPVSEYAMLFPDMAPGTTKGWCPASATTACWSRSPSGGARLLTAATAYGPASKPSWNPASSLDLTSLVLTHPSELRWSQLQAIAVGGAGLQAFYRRVSPLHRLETGVQAIQLSPYRAGLAEPALQRFRTVAAFPTCYFPLWLSPLGGSGDPYAISNTRWERLQGDMPSVPG